MYFIKQTSSWQANNSLKKYLSPLLAELSGQQVENPADVIAYLTGKLDFANQYFKKCTPQKLTSRDMTRLGDKSQFVTLGEIGELAFYPILKTFSLTPPQTPDQIVTRPLGPIQPSCRFPRLSLHQQI